MSAGMEATATFILRGVLYEYDKEDPTRHTARIRARLSLEQQQCSYDELYALWASSGMVKKRKDALSLVFNSGCADRVDYAQWPKMLAAARLHPAILELKPKVTRGSKSFTDRMNKLRIKIENVKKNRAAKLALLEGGDSYYDVWTMQVSEGEERSDKARYNELRKKACCEAALEEGADPETEMPTTQELPQIVAAVRKPPFQRVAAHERRANVRKYTRQYCFVCASLFTLKGGLTYVEHSHLVQSGLVFDGELFSLLFSSVPERKVARCPVAPRAAAGGAPCWWLRPGGWARAGVVLVAGHWCGRLSAPSPLLALRRRRHWWRSCGRCPRCAG